MAPKKPAPPKKAARSVPRPMPAALVKNAEKAAASKRERLATEARADISLIRARRERIVEDFYDIGEALVRLQRDGVAESIGYKRFADLCEAELEMSGQKAAQLIAIVKAMPREQARSLGQERASALLALAEATPEEDSAGSLALATLKLPSGKKLDLAKATTRQIREAAKAVRQTRSDPTAKKARGTTTSAEDRATVAALEDALQRHGVKEARVTAVAQPGRRANMRIERVPVACLAEVGKAVADVLKQARSTKKSPT